MRFSIVCPNWEEMPVFRDWFLRSLEAQTFSDFEVIVVDGGSKDESYYAALESGLDIMFFIDDTRNIGYIRDRGCRLARGEIVFNTSSDVYLPPRLLEELDAFFTENCDAIALSGRTRPSSSLLAYLGYGGFDFVRWAMTRFTGRIRPSGNFFAIRRRDYLASGGYPWVIFGEDGRFGERLDVYRRKHGGKVHFRLDLYVVHRVKRFEQRGSLRSIAFYLPSLARHVLPFMSPMLERVEGIYAEQFKNRSDLS